MYKHFICFPDINLRSFQISIHIPIGSLWSHPWTTVFIKNLFFINSQNAPRLNLLSGIHELHQDWVPPPLIAFLSLIKLCHTYFPSQEEEPWNRLVSGREGLLLPSTPTINLPLLFQTNCIQAIFAQLYSTIPIYYRWGWWEFIVTKGPQIPNSFSSCSQEQAVSSSAL